MAWAVVLQIGAISDRRGGRLRRRVQDGRQRPDPFLLLGWIPVVGWLLTQLRAVVLTVIGERELYRLDTGKAVAVAVVALVLYLMVSWVLGLIGITMATGLAGLTDLLG